MKRLRVATIVGTRPELIRLSRVMAELDERAEHIVIHTGQNFDYELNGLFFEELGLRRPDHFLEAAADEPAATIGQVIARVDPVLRETKPDAVLLLGDTNSCLAAIAAKRRKIPIFHMEAGNRAFDQRIPEEINRRIVDHLSDINLPYSEHARRYLLAEGFHPDRIIKTGSPLFEVIEHHRGDIETSEILQELGLAPGEFFVASIHREENVDESSRLEKVVESLNRVADHYEKPVVLSTHPRTRKRLGAPGAPKLSPRIQALDPLGFFAYVRLQTDAFCVLSDSGSLSEEASILNLRAVTLRDAHERPEGMEETAVVMAGLGAERVLQAVELVTTQQERGSRAFPVVADYAVRNVSQKVVRIILSYTDYVNRVVWGKST